jgi:hypothetical protein
MDPFLRSRPCRLNTNKGAILPHARGHAGGTLHVQPLLQSHVPKAAASLINDQTFISACNGAEL